MNKMYVKPNTKVLAVKAEQLMAAVSGNLSNDSYDVSVDSNTGNGDFMPTTSSKLTRFWDYDDEDVENDFNDKL